MESIEAIKKKGIWFRWRVSLARDSKHYQYLDQHIRQCEQDYLTLSQERVSKTEFETMKELFKEDPNVCFFVHDSQAMCHADFCLLLDIASPEEHSLLRETVLMVSEKFYLFETDAVEEAFIKELYSKENTKRLRKLGLELDDISRYRY